MPLPSESQVGNDLAAVKRDIATLCREALSDAPRDGGLYGRQSGSWARVDTDDELAAAVLDRIVVDVHAGLVVVDPSTGTVVHT